MKNGERQQGQQENKTQIKWRAPNAALYYIPSNARCGHRIAVHSAAQHAPHPRRPRTPAPAPSLPGTHVRTRRSIGWRSRRCMRPLAPPTRRRRPMPRDLPEDKCLCAGPGAGRAARRARRARRAVAAVCGQKFLGNFLQRRKAREWLVRRAATKPSSPCGLSSSNGLAAAVRAVPETDNYNGS